MITKENYLENPCRASSIPYWKAKNVSVPDSMKILHNEDFTPEFLQWYTDEQYFRLIHNLQNLDPAKIPNGYSVCKASIKDFAEHINKCYNGNCISVSELKKYTFRAVYKPDLWLAVIDNSTGKIAASGIAEFDSEIGEGMLEWIQVSEEYRGRNLGTFIVNELLRRMKDMADFATVSGKCNNPSNPEALYRKCGFSGTDVWHILKNNCY
ncbi:MAG: GNAT family N-acetyltransferase [Eubacterium sp.]|nr:GNAT family N-acetyltransferase [Eubacterium sp.]